MNKKELSLLICPYCGSKFHLGQTFQKNKYHIEFGSVYCQCDEFPIISGILYLHKNRSKKILYYLRRRQFNSALCSAFEFGQKQKFLFNIFTHLNKKIRVSPTNLMNRFLITHLWKIPLPEYKYYFSRHREIESLLFFVPLSFCQAKNKTLWLNVGSGITNYYQQLHQSRSKTTIVSLENLFRNIYLSHFFFPQKNTLYLCSDAASGPHFPPNSLDIATLIDSLPFIDHQKKSLEYITKNSLKKSGILFISSQVEHLYFPDNNNIFPLPVSLIKTFFISPPQLFDEIKLCQSLFTPNSLQNSLLKKSSTPLFRYCLLWPSQRLPSNLILPQSLKKYHYTLWQNATFHWQNKIY